MTWITQKLHQWAWINPPVWSSHPNGQNFLAKISPDDTSPQGIAREFQPRAKDAPGLVFRKLAPSDAFEMGSVGVDEAGKAYKQRLYGVIIKLNREELVWVQSESALDALAGSVNISQHLPEIGPIQTLQKQLQHLRATADQTQTRIEEIEMQIKTVLEEEEKVIQARVEETGAIATPVVPYSILKQAPEHDLLRDIRNIKDDKQREEMLVMMRRMLQTVTKGLDEN